MSKTILLTGATGLVGRALKTLLLAKGYRVHGLSRNPKPENMEFKWDLNQNYIDPKALENVTHIIHLAGDSINQKWTETSKKSMRDSRINSAKLLLQACQNQGLKLDAFISASGINYYGSFNSDRMLAETDGVIENDFLAQLCVDWEAAAKDFAKMSQRVVCLRTAVVLAQEGGTYPLLKKMVDFHLASPLASGKQAMNWIHIDDLCQMYLWAIEQDLEGSYNAVAAPITNHDFMKKMAKSLGKFFLPIPVPAFILRLLKGEMSEILIKASFTSAQKIKDSGFEFKYFDFDTALHQLNQK